MLTKEIEDKLQKSEQFDNGIIEKNSAPEYHVLLNKHINEKNLTKAEVIRMLNIDRNYGYQILNGTRKPTRNCLLQISLILELDIEQIDYLFRLAEKPPLYVRNIVDAKVFYAVKHKLPYKEAFELIWGASRVL